MARLFRIRLKWQVLVDHISEQDGQPVHDDYIRTWLIAGGFIPTDAGRWIVSEPDLGQLDPSEVESIEDAGLTGQAVW